ncbi:MAG: DUF4440 domain-containing protein [Rhodospirillaceae bacterium]|nr:MAG: DUF4440 domain-containing protein [Rhodospirillaceae bacterium]
MSDRETVLFANAAFYAAFATRDVKAMERLWASGDVMCIHPGWPPLTGREAVMASWRNILGGQNAPDISCRKAVASIYGTTAIVTCVEVITSRDETQQALCATNIFVRAAGSREWHMIHHQSGQAHIDPKRIEEDDVPPMN